MSEKVDENGKHYIIIVEMNKMRATYTPPISRKIISEIASHATLLCIEPMGIPATTYNMRHTEYETVSTISPISIKMDLVDCYNLEHVKTHADIENIIIHILRHDSATNILLERGWLDKLFSDGWFLSEIEIRSSESTTEVSDAHNTQWSMPSLSTVTASGKIHINRWIGNQHVPICDWMPIDDIRNRLSRVINNPAKYDSGYAIDNRIGEIHHFSAIMKSILKCESDGALFRRYSKKYTNPVWWEACDND